MESIELRNINIDEFIDIVYPYYIEIFPKNERKPLELIQSSYEKQYTKIMKVMYKEQMVGFMILNRVKEKGYAILDYFAILPQFRNYKYGTKALQVLLEVEKENKGIFIEIEKEGLGKNEKENVIRRRRKLFYEKLGFEKLNFDLHLYDVVYSTYLSSRIKEDEDKVIEEILEIYEAISGKEKIKRNCEIKKW